MNRSVVLTGLLIGGLCGFACSGRTWRVGNGSIDPVTGMAAQAAVAGTAVAASVRACSLAVVAGAIALLLVRGWLRVGVAALITAVAGIAAFECTRAAFDVPAHLTGTAWVWLTFAACLLSTVAGVAAVVTSGGWRSQRSTRYESPGTRRGDTEDAWQALDRGEDPTL